MVKNSHTSAGDLGSIPGQGRSPEESMAIHSNILAWESHGRRSVAGYSPQNNNRVGHDSVTKEQASSYHIKPTEQASSYSQL